MKRSARPTKPDLSTPKADSDPLAVLSRIKLEFLDEYAGEKRGYDPYDTSKDRTPDVWRFKRKRA
jgi:hypothetical protein